MFLLLGLLIYSLNLYFSEHSCFCNLIFGNRLNSRTLRSLNGLTMRQCKGHCRSRAACKAFNYRRHGGYCVLLKTDSGESGIEPEPNYLYSEKKAWQKKTPSPDCENQCSETEVCRIDDGQINCKVRECSHPKTTDSPFRSIQGNLWQINSKIIGEMGCYDVLSNTTFFTNVSAVCNASGDWSIETMDCPQDIYGLVKHEGCYIDQDPRVLSDVRLDSSQMTVTLCAQFCYQDSHEYFGVQFAKECFCGHTFNNIGTSNNCTMPCTGDPAETCGGRWALNLYTYLN